MRTHRIDILAGTTLREAVLDAFDITLETDEAVNFYFNGVPFWVLPQIGFTAKQYEYAIQKKITYYHHVLDIRSREYRATPECKAREKQRNEEIKAIQTMVNNLVDTLPELLTKDVHHGLLLWLTAYIPLSDNNKIDARRSEVVNLLKHNGYSNGTLTGHMPKYYSSPTRQMQYVCGQVISMVENIGCIHPGLADMIFRMIGHDSKEEI